MSLPTGFLTHTITVEPYAGPTPYGPSYGAPVTVSCRVEDETQMVLDANGVEVVSSSKVFCDSDVDIPVESRVTVDGRTTRVLSVLDLSTGGLSTMDHLEVALA